MEWKSVPYNQKFFISRFYKQTLRYCKSKKISINSNKYSASSLVWLFMIFCILINAPCCEMNSPVYNIIYGNLFCVLISVRTCAEDASVSDGFPFSWGHLKTETICLSLKFYSIIKWYLCNCNIFEAFQKLVLDVLYIIQLKSNSMKQKQFFRSFALNHQQKILFSIS